MKVFQISSELNIGSVGRIAEQIGEAALLDDWESYIAYGRASRTSSSIPYKIGSNIDVYFHVLLTRFTDKHGMGSRKATIKLIQEINKIQPDIIQLQHLHGYFINIQLLFEYLSTLNIPIVWTFHDCWAFTGHCTHYEFINCQKWQVQCEKCPQTHEYPKAYIDNSFENYSLKRELFNSVRNLTIVPVSNWLCKEVQKSFLQQHKLYVIHNGIDLSAFSISNKNELKSKHRIKDKFVILGVANPWSTRKGLDYFIRLADILDKSKFLIILIGLAKSQIKTLPPNIIGIEKTESISILSQYYSLADVFVNPTLEDTFPTTNLEALACGTPVVTFRSGGSPESIDANTGIVVEKEDLKGLEQAIYSVCNIKKEYWQENCRNRAEKYFDKKNCFKKYLKLYKELI